MGSRKDTTVSAGSRLEFYAEVGGTANQYQWYKGYSDISGATDPTLVLDPVEPDDTGEYSCKITNSLAPDLTLYTRPVYVEIEGFGAEADSLALVALYNATHGDEWTNNENWLSGPVDSWHGISTHNRRVTVIRLYNNNLNGTLPPDIGNLVNLISLNLSLNQLTGSIPREIGNLVHLTNLSLYTNDFSGSIPKEFGNLSKLRSFSCFSNSLEGAIPPEIGNLVNLNSIHLGNNNLSGPIPEEFANLTELSSIYLYNNDLSGDILNRIIHFVNLSAVSIQGNQFSGRIPKELCDRETMYMLHLNDNQFSGPIPNEIGNLQNLQFLHLNANEFDGSIPASIGNLSNLKRLSLSDNNLSGPVPIEFNQLEYVERMYLHNNQLTDLPDLSGLDSLEYLRVHTNQFTFEDIEPNLSIPEFSYIPQDSIGSRRDTTINEGEALELSVTVGGSANRYQWYKDDAEIDGAQDSVFTIAAVSESDAGKYICHITSSTVTDLTLYSRPVTVSVSTESGIDEPEQIPLDFALQPELLQIRSIR
ncbi:MAG: immunoglobulin domain-containing protein [candidate division KSB1 bacterium]|nr:immunoglobulin domain-containing protein [candidate division KSB1 bacterium]